MEINYSTQQNIAIISWNMTSSSMNVLNDYSIPAFEACLQKAYADDSIKGIIITSDKPEFIAGADLKMILRNNDKSPEEMIALPANLHRIFRTMETCGKPIVAAMNGTTLGGGYEVCLASHYRIALDSPKSVIGLVEVTIGLLPGAGGTQRLPRMLGIEATLPLLLEGKKLSPSEALRTGMVDALAVTKEEMMEKARTWILTNPNPIQPWDEIKGTTQTIQAKENFSIPKGDVKTEKGEKLFEAATTLVLEKTKGNYPAPLAILKCLYEGLQVNIDEGLRIETKYFVQLLCSKEAKSLIGTMFLGMNEANKGASRPKNVAPTEVKKLGIVGAGFMGSGIAYVSAMAGIEVVLKDISLETAEKGKEYSRKLLQKSIEKGKTTQEKGEKLLNLIKTTETYDDLKGTELIIEAVFENRELKRKVTKEAEPMLALNGVFASNTSTIPISLLAEASSHPANFVGIHFFSPVDKMQLVEIIAGKKSSDYALALAFDFVKKIRKTAIVVNDSRGFYTSRTFSTYTTEGMDLLLDGVDPVLIEEAGKNAGMPVGPLAVTDEVAIDLSYKIANEYVKAGSITENDTSYKVSKLMAEELGRLGKKNRKGFYEYPADGSKKYLWEGLGIYFPVSKSQPTEDEIKTRLLYRQSVEAIRCLEEGVLRTKLDGDLGSILGWGFPTYTGGALSFVDFVGKEQFIKECERLTKTYGMRFALNEKQKELIHRMF